MPSLSIWTAFLDVFIGDCLFHPQPQESSLRLSERVGQAGGIAFGHELLVIRGCGVMVVNWLLLGGPEHIIVS